MKQLMWLPRLVLKAAIFFMLFAFALNNQRDVTVHFFFGTYWRGPLVLVILAVFAAGVVLGAVGMAPSRQARRRLGSGDRPASPAASPALPPAQAAAPPHGS